jgi:dTDP-4-dehydrorhamnose reductase
LLKKLFWEQIIRIWWCALVGYSGGGQNAKNFVVQRIKEAQSSTSGIIFSNQEQYGCPTFVDDLAQRVLDLMSLKANGIFNVVNTGAASRLEYVQEIVRLLGLGITIVPTNANNFKRIAPVSNNEMAVNWRSECFGLPSMRSWTDALTEYLASNCIKEILI